MQQVEPPPPGVRQEPRGLGRDTNTLAPAVEAAHHRRERLTELGIRVDERAQGEQGDLDIAWRALGDRIEQTGRLLFATADHAGYQPEKIDPEPHNRAVLHR